MALPFLRWVSGRAVRVVDGTLTAWPYAFVAFQALRIWATGAPSGVELFVRTLPALLLFEFFLVFHDFVGGSILRAKSRVVRLLGFILASAMQGAVALMVSDMMKVPEVIDWFLMLLPWRFWSAVVRDQGGYWAGLGAVRALTFLATACPVFLYFRGHLPLWGLTGVDLATQAGALKGFNGELPDILFWAIAYCSVIAPSFFLASLWARHDERDIETVLAEAEKVPMKATDFLPGLTAIVCVLPLVVESLFTSERVSVATTLLALVAFPALVLVWGLRRALRLKGT